MPKDIINVVFRLVCHNKLGQMTPVHNPVEIEEKDYRYHNTKERLVPKINKSESKSLLFVRAQWWIIRRPRTL